MIILPYISQLCASSRTVNHMKPHEIALKSIKFHEIPLSSVKSIESQFFPTLMADEPG